MWSMTKSIHFNCGARTGRVTEIMAVFLFVVILAATFTTTTSAATNTKPPSVVDSKKPSAAATEFLRARCNTVGEVFSNLCYNSLLPHADSINGSDVKLAHTATAILVGRLQASVREMRHANSTGQDPMIGRRNGCLQLFEEATDGDRQALASLRRLEATSNGGKLSGRDLDDVKNWIDKVQMKVGKCSMDLDAIQAELPVTLKVQVDLHVAIPLFQAILK